MAMQCAEPQRTQQGQTISETPNFHPQFPQGWVSAQVIRVLALRTVSYFLPLGVALKLGYRSACFSAPVHRPYVRTTPGDRSQKPPPLHTKCNGFSIPSTGSGIDFRPLQQERHQQQQQHQHNPPHPHTHGKPQETTISSSAKLCVLSRQALRTMAVKEPSTTSDLMAISMSSSIQLSHQHRDSDL